MHTVFIQCSCSCVLAAAPHVSELISGNVEYVGITIEKWRGLNYDLYE